MMYRKFVDGVIEIICGPMFAGKTQELIRRINLLHYAGIETLVIKPTIDDRWSKSEIISRSGYKIDAVAVKSSKEILDFVQNKKYQAIAIDEAQFFDDDIIDIVKQLSNKGIRIMISALDTDFAGRPFGPTPSLLAIADDVTKLAAACFVCGLAATMTHRNGVMSSDIIAVGNEEYEARCRAHHAVAPTSDDFEQIDAVEKFNEQKKA